MRFDLEQRPGYLYAGLQGEFELASAQANLREFLEAAARLGHSRLLLDSTRLRGSMTMEDRMQFGVFLAQEFSRFAGRFKELPRIAILAAPPIMDPGRFTQTVANNRGAHMRASDSLQELLSWLEV